MHVHLEDKTDTELLQQMVEEVAKTNPEPKKKKNKKKKKQKAETTQETKEENEPNEPIESEEEEAPTPTKSVRKIDSMLIVRAFLIAKS